MKVIHPKEFKAERAWGSLPITEMNGIGIKLHWTDKPYIWHVNDGEEIFVVLDGQVDMYYKKNDKENCVKLIKGDIFFAEINDAHKAHPIGEARILVIEKMGSK